MGGPSEEPLTQVGALGFRATGPLRGTDDFGAAVASEAIDSVSGAMTTSTDHPFADILNAGRKVVFSRTLKTADWANTTIAAGDTAVEIDKLRQGGDGHIVVWGGVSLWRSLMRST